MMIERLVYQAVEAGIALLTETPALLVDFLQKEALLGETEALKIRDIFLEKPPTVIHGYARADGKFPLYAIVVTRDQQSLGFIGDEGAFHDDPDDPDYGSDDWAAIFDYTVTVFTYAQHPDVTLYYYHLLKRFIIGAERLFKGADFFDTTYAGGDMAPDANTAPAGLFVRSLEITTRRQYNLTDIESRLGRSWRLRGLHVSRDGAVGEDIGDVDDNIGLYTTSTTATEDEEG